MPAQEFVALVILVGFLKIPDWERGCMTDLQVVELFSGVARIAKLASWMGFRARACDLLYEELENPYKPKRGQYRRAPMDINGSAGMTQLGGYLKSLVPCIHPESGFTTPPGLRLAVALCLAGAPNALVTCAIVCSSWSAVNLGTSQRDLLLPYGNWTVPSVRAGNRMVGRPFS